METVESEPLIVAFPTLPLPETSEPAPLTVTLSTLAPLLTSTFVLSPPVVTFSTLAPLSTLTVLSLPPTVTFSASCLIVTSDSVELMTTSFAGTSISTSLLFSATVTLSTFTPSSALTVVLFIGLPTVTSAAVVPSLSVTSPPRMTIRPSTVTFERSIASVPTASVMIRSPLITEPERSTVASFTMRLPSTVLPATPTPGFVKRQAMRSSIVANSARETFDFGRRVFVESPFTTPASIRAFVASAAHAETAAASLKLAEESACFFAKRNVRARIAKVCSRVMESFGIILLPVPLMIFAATPD